MNKTIEEIKAAKQQQLEQDILKQLQDFEKSYGVEVTSVRLDSRCMTISENHIQTVDIVVVL